MLAWMDLEMTGLDVRSDVIVEIATLITDDQLNVIAEGPNIVCTAPAEKLENLDPVVADMHTRSGLLERIRQSTVTVDEAGAATLEFLQAHISEPRTVPLCGNSIGTDRRFLDRYLPDIENFLHYRSVDVSTIKELARRWHPEMLAAMPRKATAHRALDDIKESLAELKYWRGTIFVPSAATDALAMADGARN